MSTTLTYGRKLPTDGDRGSTWFDDLETNIALDDAHTHDGVTSPLIPANNIGKSNQILNNANWVAVGGQQGTYKQTVTMPSGVTMANAIIKVQDYTGAIAGDFIHPTIEYVSGTSYDIFINDNTLDVLVTYG